MVVDRNLWAKYVVLRRVVENMLSYKRDQFVLNHNTLEFLKSALADLERAEK